MGLRLVIQGYGSSFRECRLGFQCQMFSVKASDPRYVFMIRVPELGVHSKESRFMGSRIYAQGQGNRIMGSDVPFQSQGVKGYVFKVRMGSHVPFQSQVLRIMCSEVGFQSWGLKVVVHDDGFRDRGYWFRVGVSGLGILGQGLRFHGQHFGDNNNNALFTFERK